MQLPMLQANTPALAFHAPTIGSMVALAIACIGLLLSAFMSGSEIAYFSLTDTDIENINDERKQQGILNLLRQPERLLATILVSNNLVNVMIVTLSSFALTQMLEFHSTLLEFLVITVILTFLILLFGEILPKLYANSCNVKFAIGAHWLLNLLFKMFAPITKVMVKSTRLVKKVVTKKSDDISMDDLSKALEISDVKAEDEKELLEGILKFGDTTVSAIMRPRVDVQDLDYDSTFDEVVSTVVESGYSRIPVYKDSPDNIKGILYAKDLLPYIGKQGKNFNWQRLLRDVYFVPETRMIDDLLEDFRRRRLHFAVVVDEFGCTQGIATLEDVLEEIVGDIDDEYDTVEKFYTKLADGSYIFDGKTVLNDFFRVTDVDEEEMEPVIDGAETLAGLLLNIKCDFLREKETVQYGRCKFLVLNIDKRRITKVRVTITPRAE